MSNELKPLVFVTVDEATGTPCYAITLDKPIGMFNDYRNDLLPALRQNVPNFEEPALGQKEFCCLVHFQEEKEFHVLYLDWTKVFGRDVICLCRSRRSEFPNKMIRAATRPTRDLGDPCEEGIDDSDVLRRSISLLTNNMIGKNGKITIALSPKQTRDIVVALFNLANKLEDDSN